MEDRFERFPAELPAAGRGAASFVRDPSRFAVRGVLPAELRERVEDRLEEESLSVVAAPADAAAVLRETDLVPVYVLGEGGAAFVPTGRATVRFGSGDDARAHETDLREIGYRIIEVPPYAPHLAWIESATGDIAHALTGLDAVGRLPGVEHVEPQLVTRGERR